jgi:peptide/nickel transport system ATP-binding protein
MSRAAIMPAMSDAAMSQPGRLLEVVELSVRFRIASRLRAKLAGLPGRFVEAVSDVSLSVGDAESVGLVGESGSGKTTLARAILRIVPAQSGRVLLEGEEIPEASDAALRPFRRKVAMMFQDPVGSLSPRLSVRGLVTEPFRIHGVEQRDPRQLLAMVGLGPGYLARYPHQLSGGEARRVGIARALALSPRLVVADEPTAGLDVSVQGDVLNLLARLRRELGLALLLITHNLGVVRRSTDRIGVMYMGRLVEQGPTAEVFDTPAHPYTHALIAALPVADPGRRHAAPPIRGEVPSLLARPSGCSFRTRCPKAQPRCAAETPPPAPLPNGRTVRCFFPMV